MFLIQFSVKFVLYFFQVAEIWYNYLDRIVRMRTKTPPTPKGIGPIISSEDTDNEDQLGINN